MPRLIRPLLAALVAITMSLVSPSTARMRSADQLQHRTIIWLSDAPSIRAGTHAKIANSRRSSLLEQLKAQVVMAPLNSRFIVANLSAEQLSALQTDTRVISISSDHVLHLATEEINPPSWGLDRIDQAALPLDQHYFSTADGTGADVYVMDTGVDATHVAFGDRVEPGVNFVADAYLSTQDPNGHGTHVAGTAAGYVYGIAQGAEIIPVRVLDAAGSGWFSAVIAGLDWIRLKATERNRPAVVNISLGAQIAPGSVSAELQEVLDAVDRATAAGVLVITAAGNSADNACNMYPGGAATNAVTVAATNTLDARASYSNSGSCVDLFAPGSSITSAHSGGGSSVLSGTSMAAPHVAGVAVLLRALDPTATPANITQQLIEGATTGKVTDANGSPNRLLRVPCRAVGAGLPCLVSPPPSSAFIQPGTTLYSGSSVWERATSVTYSFYRCATPGPAVQSVPDLCAEVSTNSSYVVQFADYGMYIRRAHRAINSFGNVLSLSATSGQVASLGRVQDPLVISAAPATMFVGQVAALSLSGGSGSGLLELLPQTPSRCVVNGATVTALAVGDCQLVLRRWEDAVYGTAVSSVVSIGILQLSGPLVTADVVLSSSPIVNQQFAPQVGSWSGTPSPTLTYRWFRCTKTGVAVSGTTIPSGCSVITGGTGASYTPVSADFGKLLRLQSTATNSQGSASRFSATSAPVVSGPLVSSVPSISGTAKIGKTLTGNTGRYSGSTPLGYTYQWFSCLSKVNAAKIQPVGCREIVAATSTKYGLTSAEVNRFIVLRVTASNPYGLDIEFSGSTAVVK